MSQRTLKIPGLAKLIMNDDGKGANLTKISFFFREVVHLGEEAHLNTSFKHFIYFVQVRFLAIFIFA